MIDETLTQMEIAVNMAFEREYLTVQVYRDTEGARYWYAMVDGRLLGQPRVTCGPGYLKLSDALHALSVKLLSVKKDW